MAIWDDPSKVQGRWGADKTKFYSANSYKCPSCASNIKYDAKRGFMICSNCGGLFDPDTLEKLGSFGITNPERDYDGTIEVSKDDENRVEIVCNSCGAEIISDKNTSSTFCAFCGSPALVTRRLTREFKPDYIIPFKFDKAKAISIFEEHCAGISHLPKNFNSKKVLEKMTGLYVPTWIISSEVEVKVSGQGRKGKMVDDAYAENFAADWNNYQHLTFGRVKLRLKNVPFDGEIKIANNLFAAAEPFDYSELVPFRAEYLQGFFAEKYDQLPLDMTDRIYRRLDKYALSVCEQVTFGYDTFVPNSDASTTRYDNQKILYALLPCWFITIEYDGIRYQYIINGQTGKVSGDFPYAKGWEKIHRTQTHARMEAVSLNFKIRSILYLLPTILYGIARGFSSRGSSSHRVPKFAESLFANPLEVVIILITIGALLYLIVEILPKIMRNQEKKDIQSLSKTTSHDLAPEPGVEEYFDTAFPISAVETTQDYVTLEAGWKYGEKEAFDFKTAMPDAEEVGNDDNSTEFEKQGHDREMLR